MKKFMPKRRLIKSKGTESWVYKDPKEHALAIKATALQFNLIEFDTWLIKFEPCIAKDELIERRKAALNTLNLSELQRHLEFLHLRCIALREGEFKAPFINKGKIAHDKEIRQFLKKIKEKMKPYKTEGKGVKNFLSAASKGSIEGLSTTDLADENAGRKIYEFCLELDNGEEISIARSISTIGKWWTSCA